MCRIMSARIDGRIDGRLAYLKTELKIADFVGGPLDESDRSQVFWTFLTESPPVRHSDLSADVQLARTRVSPALGRHSSNRTR